MTIHCSVEGCLSSVHTPGVKFFCFPRPKERCYAWIKFCGDDHITQYLESRVTTHPERYRVCSLHFRKEDFRNSRMEKLLTGVVPSLNGPPAIVEYAAISPTVVSSVHSASPTSDAEPPTPSSSPLPRTVPNSIPTPCISSIPSISSINLLPGPSHAPIRSSNARNSSVLLNSTSFNDSVSVTRLPLGTYSVSNISAHEGDDLVGVNSPHGNIVARTESSCRKVGFLSSNVGISRQLCCTPCQKWVYQYRKQKKIEIKRLRMTIRKLKMHLRKMRERLANQQSVDSQI